MSGHHGRDQIQRLTLAATQGRHGHRPQGRPARRHGRLPRPGHARACRSSAPSCSTRSTSSRPTGSTARTCSPTRPGPTPTAAPAGRRRPSRIERMMDELAVELGMDPIEVREQNWIKHEEFPFTTVAGLTYDSRQLRGGHRAGRKELFGYDELRRRAGASAASAGTRCSWASASRPSPRCAGWRRPGCSARCDYGAGGWENAVDPDAADRQGRGRHRRRARTARATRRRGARSSPTGSASRSRTSRCCTATPRSRPRAWTPTARARWSSAASRVVKAADKVIEKAKPIAAHLLEASVGRPRVRAAAGSRSGAPTRAWRMAEIAFAVFAAHNLPDGVEPTLDADATFDPENFSFPHGTHLCAVEVDTETGRGDDPQVRLRRRHRQGGQPADRRGPGARRPRPGHRPGAVRGGGLRRRRAR